MPIKYRIEVSPTNINHDILNNLHVRLLENINNSSTSTKNFQASISEITGSQEVLAVSSGTAALHLSLLALGIKEGDYIACSTFTFVATVNAISYLKAKPVFVDSEEVTWNMCPQLLEKAILESIKNGKKIKAVIIVHAYGFPAQIEQLINICKIHDVYVIEDAASALGSKYKNKSLGTFGTIGILSFNYNKIITTTGGGIFMTKSRELQEKASFFANQAKSFDKNNEHHEIGYNYKMSGMSAELGNVQLPYLQQYIHIKRELFSRYKDALNNNGYFKFLEEEVDSFSNRWITTILLKDKAILGKIKTGFEEKSIEVRNLWKPMHIQPVFSSCLSYINGSAENFFNYGLCLPSGINLQKKDQDSIIKLLLSFF